MANSTNLLSATITATDVSSNVPINRGLGNPSFAGSVGQFGQQAATGGVGVDTSVPFPTGYTVMNQVYLKNLAAPGGATITVKWTPQGGASATIMILQPGSVLILWEVAAGATSGITALSVAGSSAATPYEYFLGA